MLAVRVKKAFDCPRVHSITRVHEDLEFLVSRWCVESHKFCWLGRVGPTLEDVLNLMALPLYGETNTMGVTFEGEDEDKL